MVIDALAKYLRGEIDNFSLDDAICFRTSDKTLAKITGDIWFSYDDVKRHHVSLDRPGWQSYRRCIAFLQTDLELPPVMKDDPRDHIWPFQARADIFRLRPDLSSFRLPRFDPAIHDVPIRGRAMTMAIWIHITFIAVLALVAIFRWLF
jgi:hypothetical protein